MEVLTGDVLDVLPTLEDSSVDLIVTDPPYFKVKNLDWDKAWAKPKDFLEWMGLVLDEFHRVLKPNGSLYIFASPQMAWGVEGVVRERFNVLNNIRWIKEGQNIDRRHVAQILNKGLSRSFLPNYECCIFAEHFNADNIAKGEAGYAKKCDELRGFLFEPLRDWFVSEWNKSGLKRKQVDEYCGCSNCTQYWFSEREYQIPTKEKYAAIQELAPKYFSREYEELRTQYEELRTQYEELRTQYEELRRPFNVTADVPYTDVWTYPTVSPRPGKHPCEKPPQMMEDIINASSRPGAVVLDAFCGSGVVGEACAKLGREFIGIDMQKKWAEATIKRIYDQHALNQQLSIKCTTD